MVSKEMPAPQTPEVVAEKPKSILKRIQDILEPHTKGEKPMIFIAGVTEQFEISSSAGIIVSPQKNTFDINSLNHFAGTIAILLEKDDIFVRSMQKTEAKPIKRDEGIIYPKIFILKKEDLGKEKTTKEFHLSDPFLTPVDPRIKVFSRDFTTITVCPNPQIAELAKLAANSQYDRLPKGFGKGIQDKVTKKQLDIFRKALPKPIKN